MVPYTSQTWSQLKGITTKELQNALERDGWELQKNKGLRGKKGANTLAYRHPERPSAENRVVLHPHPKKTMGANLLKQLLATIGWDEDDLRRLKLVK